MNDRRRHIPLAPPSPATLAAQEAKARRDALYGDAPQPDVNQIWVHRHTTQQVRLLGRRTTTWVALQLGAEPIHIDIDLDDHAANYAYVRSDCDHETVCCGEHGTHASPHRNCILR